MKTGWMAWMIAPLAALAGCTHKTDRTEEFQWVVDRFDDIRVMRYQVPGFEQLPLGQKELLYYLSEAAKCGRDILFDQNFRYNLPIRRTLEGIYTTWKGDRSTEEWKALEKYLKKVWFANGIHHHYGNYKFTPEFSPAYFDEVFAATPDEALPLDFGTREELLSTLRPILFDPALYPMRLDQREGIDMLRASAMNYYDGVSQAEAEAFYAAKTDPSDPQPPSYGLNTQLARRDGRLVERVWKEDGMYGPAIGRILYWLEKAHGVACEPQKETIARLMAYYRSGDPKDFDAYNICWVQDTVSSVDFVNGFIEDYGDPLGKKAAWEGNASFRNDVATRRTQTISENAQWFEDHSPVDPRFRKKEVKGVTAKVINVTMLGGDSYPSTPIGINLPNADWIRRDYGSKSVTIDNITAAYKAAAHGNGFDEEFVLRPEDRERISRWDALGDNLHTDLHECLGHGSGQLLPGVKGNELRNYGSTLEEARADLFGLYYLGDPKMVELGLIPTLDVAKAQYASYLLNGLMTQLSRIQPGHNVEEAHMRNRKLIAEWCYEQGRAENVIEWVVSDGKRYVVVNDFDKLRTLFGRLLGEVQRIKSEGDYEAGRTLVETYAVTVDPDLHREVLERYAALHIEPYGGFINPEYTLVEQDGKVVDVAISWPDNYVEQMLRYGRDYSFLPSRN